MRTRSALTAAVLSVAGLLALACAIPAAPEFPESPDPEPTTTTPVADVPTPTESLDSLEGAFDYDTMGAYVAEVVAAFMNPWLNDTWPDMREPFVRYVERDETGPQNCIDATGEPGYYSGYSYEYCPGDETVYVGQETLWEFYLETGDAGPAMGIAHEYGHHVQYMLGVRPPRTPAQSVQYENQADCISGAWARWMEQHGYLETAQNSPNGRSDLDDIRLMFPIIASAEGEDRDHGTLEERARAFGEGYLRGVGACDLE
jgi:hypothetical protein